MCRKPLMPLMAILVLCSSVGCAVAKVLAVASQKYVEVMSFNIFHDASDAAKNIPGWSSRRPIVVGTIQSQNPDVVGLQEAYMWQVTDLKSDMPQYASVGRGRDDDGGGESVSILYLKEKYDLLESGHFWFSDSPGSAGSKWPGMGPPRMVTWIRLKKKSTGKTFYVYNTHFASDDTGGSSSRHASALLLAEQIANRSHSSEYFFITGDFNAGDDEFPIEYLTRRRSGCTSSVCSSPPPFTPVPAIDTWRKKHAGAGGTKCSNTDTSDGKRIDYVFVWDPTQTEGFIDASSVLSEPPTVDNAETIKWGPACPSDHRAVLAGVFIPTL
jgi:endonuclease/exonuclease/phosphatase family metal-dependent hydrolase